MYDDDNALAGGAGDDDCEEGHGAGGEEEKDDAGDAQQAPAFLAWCGHWPNIHFEMGLPTTPIHNDAL